MKKQFCSAQEARLSNIIDVGFTASAMVRVFEKRTKEKLRERVSTELNELEKVFAANSREEFDKIHSEFCDWGVKERIPLAKSPGEYASYGQIAKTFNVVLKVAIYYSHLPDCAKAKELSEWLHAAVDTKMMKELKKDYKKCIQPWPKTIKEVDKDTYKKLREVVNKFIKKKYEGRITPVEYEEIHWRKLNREEKEEVS